MWVIFSMKNPFYKLNSYFSGRKNFVFQQHSNKITRDDKRLHILGLVHWFLFSFLTNFCTTTTTTKLVQTVQRVFFPPPHPHPQSCKSCHVLKEKKTEVCHVLDKACQEVAKTKVDSFFFKFSSS